MTTLVRKQSEPVSPHVWVTSLNQVTYCEKCKTHILMTFGRSCEELATRNAALEEQRTARVAEYARAAIHEIEGRMK